MTIHCLASPVGARSPALLLALLSQAASETEPGVFAEQVTQFAGAGQLDAAGLISKPATEGQQGQTGKSNKDKKPEKDAKSEAGAPSFWPTPAMVLPQPFEVLPRGTGADGQETSGDGSAAGSAPGTGGLETELQNIALAGAHELAAATDASDPKTRHAATTTLPAPAEAVNAEPAPEIAFAARVRTGTDASSPDGQAPGSHALAPAVAAPPVRKAHDATLPGRSLEPQDVSRWFAAGAASEPQGNKAEKPQAEAEPAVAAPAEHLPVQADLRPSQPVTALRDLSLQVANDRQERVEVRLTERAGELHVAVRTADPELSSGLRQQLPELVGRLQESGFRSETWRPGQTAGAVTATAETHRSSGDFRHSDWQGQPGGSQQQQHRREQHDANSSQRPRWVEEMESTLSGEELTRS